MKKHDSYPKLEFKNPKEFEEFLKEKGESVIGIWVKIAKKDSGVESITYAEALQVALCYGWIDGQAAGFDEIFSLVKFTPRGPRSLWSKRNVGYVEELIKSGRMKKSGFLRIEEAKKDGRWERAYLGSADAKVPEDFIKEVKKDKKAYELFQTLSKQNLYVIYFKLQTAPNSQVRLNRMNVILDKLKSGDESISFNL